MSKDVFTEAKSIQNTIQKQQELLDQESLCTCIHDFDEETPKSQAPRDEQQHGGARVIDETAKIRPPRDEQQNDSARVIDEMPKRLPPRDDQQNDSARVIDETPKRRPQRDEQQHGGARVIDETAKRRPPRDEQQHGGARVIDETPKIRPPRDEQQNDSARVIDETPKRRPQRDEHQHDGANEIDETPDGQPPCHKYQQRATRDTTCDTGRSGERLNVSWVKRFCEDNDDLSCCNNGGNSAFMTILRRLQLSRFGGDSVDWPSFISLFKCLVHDQLLNGHAKNDSPTACFGR